MSRSCQQDSEEPKQLALAETKTSSVLDIGNSFPFRLASSGWVSLIQSNLFFCFY